MTSIWLMSRGVADWKLNKPFMEVRLLLKSKKKSCFTSFQIELILRHLKYLSS